MSENVSARFYESDLSTCKYILTQPKKAKKYFLKIPLPTKQYLMSFIILLTFLVKSYNTYIFQTLHIKIQFLNEEGRHKIQANFGTKLDISKIVIIIHSDCSVQALCIKELRVHFAELKRRKSKLHPILNYKFQVSIESNCNKEKF